MRFPIFVFAAALMAGSPLFAADLTPGPVVIAVADDSLEVQLTTFESLAATLRQADDAALADALVQAFQRIAESAGDKCKLAKESLNDDAAWAQTMAYILETLGMQPPPAPDYLSILVSGSAIDTRMNALRLMPSENQAGDAVRVDNLRTGLTEQNERVKAAIEGALQSGRLKMADDKQSLQFTDGCAG